MKTLTLAMVLGAAACSEVGLAQVAPPTILQIDLADHVLYFQDLTAADPSRHGADPGTASVQLSAAWIAGNAVRIAAQ